MYSRSKKYSAKFVGDNDFQSFIQFAMVDIVQFTIISIVRSEKVYDLACQMLMQLWSVLLILGLLFSVLLR